jgi:uncharacterized protein YjbI with pentapeptide repeats
MTFVRRGVKAAVLILGAILLLAAIAVGVYFGGKWLWGELAAYIRPSDATERKDLVNTFVLIGAGIVGAFTAFAALLNAYFTRRNLQNAREALRQQRDLEEQRAQEDALQAYFERIGDLLTNHNLTHTDRDDIRQLAEAQTLTVVVRLDGSRKRSLIRFLLGAELIDRNNPIVDLSGADFRYAHLEHAHLDRAHLSSADLSGANLNGANLSDADLSHADLSHADLSDTEGITNEELEQQADSLEGAIMPNGQKYEDWLKSKGSGRD